MRSILQLTLELVGDNKVTIYEQGPTFEVHGFIEANGDKLTLVSCLNLYRVNFRINFN